MSCLLQFSAQRLASCGHKSPRNPSPKKSRPKHLRPKCRSLPQQPRVECPLQNPKKSARRCSRARRHAVCHLQSRRNHAGYAAARFAWRPFLLAPRPRARTQTASIGRDGSVGRKTLCGNHSCPGAQVPGGRRRLRCGLLTSLDEPASHQDSIAPWQNRLRWLDEFSEGHCTGCCTWFAFTVAGSAGDCASEPGCFSDFTCHLLAPIIRRRISWRLSLRKDCRRRPAMDFLSEWRQYPGERGSSVAALAPPANPASAAPASAPAAPASAPAAPAAVPPAPTSPAAIPSAPSNAQPPSPAQPQVVYTAPRSAASQQWLLADSGDARGIGTVVHHCSAHGTDADPVHADVHDALCAAADRVSLFAPGAGTADHAVQPDAHRPLADPDVLSHAAGRRPNLPGLRSFPCSRARSRRWKRSAAAKRRCGSSCRIMCGKKMSRCSSSWRRNRSPQRSTIFRCAYLLPAYILSELKAGFQIGTVLFLPFLIVDMVVASITTSVGMLQLPPVVISTPLKLLLFLMVDGWHLLISSLMRSFN